MEVSPDFAEFLAGELDSNGYARSLMRPRRNSALTVRSPRRGPIAEAAEAAAARSVRMPPTVTSGTARVSPEYLRFLQEEISSWEYAEAVADCAKLEGTYRAPAARIGFPRPGFLEAAIDVLRLLFAVGGLAFLAFGLLPLLVPLGAKVVSTATQSAWTITFVGAMMVAITLFHSALAWFQGAVHLVQRFVGERLAQQ
jgi:hypothetical protein